MHCYKILTQHYQLAPALSSLNDFEILIKSTFNILLFLEILRIQIYGWMEKLSMIMVAISYIPGIINNIFCFLFVCIYMYFNILSVLVKANQTVITENGNTVKQSIYMYYHSVNKYNLLITLFIISSRTFLSLNLDFRSPQFLCSAHNNYTLQLQV